MRTQRDGYARQRRDLETIAEWVRTLETTRWEQRFAVTLHFRNEKSRQAAQKSLRVFLCKLNAKVFKNAYKKYNKRLRVISVFESCDESLHCHLLLEGLDRFPSEEFMEMVGSLWDSIPNAKTFAFGQKFGNPTCKFDIKPVTTDGWLTYIAKVRTKSSVDDFDVENMCLYRN